MMLITVYDMNGNKYRLRALPETSAHMVKVLSGMRGIRSVCQPEPLLDAGMFLAARIAAETSNEA